MDTYIHKQLQKKEVVDDPSSLEASTSAIESSGIGLDGRFNSEVNIDAYYFFDIIYTIRRINFFAYDIFHLLSGECFSCVFFFVFYFEFFDV